jgi:hypothetical protein
MKYQRPEVKTAHPVGDLGLNRLPKNLEMASLLQEDSIILYNPFQNGLTLQKVPLHTVSFTQLAKAFIVDSMHLREIDLKTHKARAEFQLLGHIAHSCFDFIKQTHGQQIYLTPRNSRQLDLEPDDMTLVPSKPSQKIEGPKTTPKPGPPKPGGHFSQ